MKRKENEGQGVLLIRMEIKDLRRYVTWPPMSRTQDTGPRT